MRLQWKGADTGSSVALRTPRSLAAATAASTAALAPETTTWPGALSLAISHTPSLAPAAQADLACTRSAPKSAAIAPSPTGTAACMARPRAFRSRAASATGIAPAAASAEISPRLWPAT